MSVVIYPVKKPRKKRQPKRRFSSIKRPSKSAAQQAAQKLREGNPERRARRTAQFKARLARADWKALRLACFERDGFRCTAVEVPAICDIGVAGYHRHVVCLDRCEYQDDTRTGKGLVADHLTYRRFGHELLSDLRTLCRSCNARLTVLTRANWQHSRRQRGK